VIISFKRFVESVEGEAFYQKRAPENRPAWLRTVTLSFPSGRKAEDFNPDYFAAKLPDRSPPDGDYRMTRRGWRSCLASHNIDTIPLLETRPMNGGLCFAISRLIRGSAARKATAISAPCSWLDVSTKALTLAVASAVRSVVR
jgi:hypothetical protein